MTVYAIYTKNPDPIPNSDSVQNTPAKKHTTNPKTGESTTLPLSLAALGFAIAGLSIIHKKRMMTENNK